MLMIPALLRYSTVFSHNMPFGGNICFLSFPFLSPAAREQCPEK